MAKSTAKKKDETCAVCDCKLEEPVVRVKIGDHVVEVCCEECAQKLGEARSSEELPS